MSPGQTIVGVSSSVTITKNVHAAVLLAPSVAVYVTALAPTANTLPLLPPAVSDTVSGTQLSSAVTAPYEATAPHDPGTIVPVVTLGGHVMLGACVSATTTSKEHDAFSPAPSVTSHATGHVPTLNVPPLASPNVFVSVAVAQLSVPFTVYVTVAWHVPVAAFAVTADDGHEIVGASLSTTVTSRVQVAVLPNASVPVNTTELLPGAKLVPLADPFVCATEVACTASQLSAPVALANVTVAEQVPAVVFATMFPTHVMVGVCTSLMITANWQLALFPAASTAKYVTFVRPIGNAVPFAGPASVRVRDVTPQLSVAVASLNVTTHVQSPAAVFC
jgi:hypothetical protein